ncbi:hypothetical protein [Aureimonas endophytica]|uniref:hypothetical protein n=1 Tax=Aureimonas endophytica TaxID=2027858 RepID=UPI00166ABB6A|nr:hypothetical protein [Aureimonas endophytica]
MSDDTVAIRHIREEMRFEVDVLNSRINALISAEAFLTIAFTMALGEQGCRWSCPDPGCARLRARCPVLVGSEHGRQDRQRMEYSLDRSACSRSGGNPCDVAPIDLQRSQGAFGSGAPERNGVRAFHADPVRGCMDTAFRHRCWQAVIDRPLAHISQ